ncbi:hypothetical protein [Bacillus sp. NH11B]|uniref:hypothetical protein n=1 Tax=Bacillus sp. NH11B TaxID=1866314 RepID=UPI0008FE2EA2|nr:hypothetical protein [Bacillus sp. NH11B]OJD68238.1 hypothetical protein BAU27_28670 [Bacillus sp. NH11B]
MNNMIKIYKFAPFIEEEVNFLVNNQEVIGFDVSPKKLEVDKEYEAEIDIFVNDILDIEEQKDINLKKIEHINNYSYMLFGEMLKDNVLDVGFFITSDLFEDYQYLIGQYVILKVDRLQLYCE